MPADLTPSLDAPPTDELASAEATLGVLQQVVHGITFDDLTKQTPCREFDVAALTSHLLNSVTQIGKAAGAEIPARDSEDSVERQIVAAARPSLDAWHRRGLGGSVPFGPREAPAGYLAGIFSLEFLVHAWDYAVATGRPISAPDALSEYVTGLAQRVITPDTRGSAGFDDPVDVSGNATALDRLVALTGRRP
jgi:uncharacterized protein (TIGR03086 family)